MHPRDGFERDAGNRLFLQWSSGDDIGIAVQNRRTLFTKATYVRVSMSSRKHDVRRSQRLAITVKIP